MVISALPASAQKMPASQLLALARNQPGELRQPLIDTLGQAAIHHGTAVIGEREDFLFAVEAVSEPALYIDNVNRGAMQRLAGGIIWYKLAAMSAGRSHNFHYLVNGAKLGGRTDIAAYGPLSYERAAVPHGTLSEQLEHTSAIYPGMKSDYWIYVPAQYDPATPTALMVWQDGQGLVQRDGATRSQIVFDNLTADHKIPVMIHVFISPGTVGTKAMRSIEYDTVNDTYARFLRDEILAEVQKKYNLRSDGYSRAIAGGSSGGICAFNVAWHQPDQFARVLSRIGSFTSIQWHPGEIDGGNVYPFKIRKEAKRAIRVWLQDGSEDLENEHGSWPLQNIQMANSLKMKGYDFHLSFGNGTHNGAHGNAELPEEMTWLWRGYDASKTADAFEQDPAEKSQPLFRVMIYTREN
jgi:enterochelin esterase family protein